MLNDPLSEAREALEQAYIALGTGQPEVERSALTTCWAALARLDALPAPDRSHPGHDAPARFYGWFYPDAPVADAAAPRQQPPAAREDGGEDA